MHRLSKRITTLKDSKVERKYGVVYEGLKIKNGPSVFLVPAFFFIRRLILAVIVVRMPELITQICAVYIQAILAGVVLSVRPLKDGASYTMEFFNEILFFGLFVTMLCFTSWISEIETKFYVGYVTCSIVVLHFFLNLMLMFCSSCKNCIRDRRLKKLLKGNKN